MAKQPSGTGSASPSAEPVASTHQHLHIHIYLNGRPILTYLKKKAKNILPANRQMRLALLLTICVTVGTIYNLPPMNKQH